MEFDIKPALDYAAKKIYARILLQMPESTGALKESLSVSVVGDSIEISYNEYGKYTNMGTDDISPLYWSAIPETTIEEVNNNLEKEIYKGLDQMEVDLGF